ncbi:hypothetical protein Zmor_008943 [Zophobas morio]|uniref:Uncharacterized protein n=1 Tax=Zophobas morio TaxID=2755281 RepID=A0AA38HK17_9CUCU|nr:hypothetical protein Zmor_008943 [Zophobas morio]
MKAEDLTLNFMGQDHAVFSATVFNMGIHHYEITVNFKLVNLDIDNGVHPSAVDTIVLDLGTIFRNTDSDTTRIKKLVEGSREFKEQNVRITRISSFTTTHAEFMASNLEGHFVKISVSFELKYNDKNNDNPAMNKNEVSLSIDLGNIRRDGVSTDIELINNALMSNKTIKDLDLHDLVSIFRSAFQARYTATKLGFEITTYTIDVRYKLLDPAQTPENGLITIPTVATELSLGTIYKSPNQSVQEVVEENVKNNATIKDLGIISFINTTFDETLSSATFIGASIGTTYNITVTFDVVDNTIDPNPGDVDMNTYEIDLGQVVVDKDQTNQEAVTKALSANEDFNKVAISGTPNLVSFDDNKAVFTGFNFSTSNEIEVVTFNVTFSITKTTPTGDQTSTLDDAFAGHMYGDNVINATNSGITLDGTDDESVIAAFLQFGNLQDTFKVSDFKVIPANEKENFNLKSQSRNQRFAITTSDTATFTIDAPFNFEVKVNVYTLNDLFGTATGTAFSQELSVDDAVKNMTTNESRIN